MPATKWNEEKIYFAKETYFKDLEKHIQSAQRTIEFETYILEDDVRGQRILEDLKDAAARGVKVRLLVDGVGSNAWMTTLIDTLAGSAVEFKIHHPFLFPHTVEWKWFRIDLIINAFARLNKRLHRKICIIDHTTAFVGSFNVTNRSNRDTAVRVKGKGVLTLLRGHEKLWRGGRKWAPLRVLSSPLLRLNDSKKLRKLYIRNLTNRLNSAQKRIWITSAYFVPPFFLLRGLWKAGLRGIDIRLLVPGRSDQAFMKLLTDTYYIGLLRNNIRIFEYQKNFLHAKTLLIDHWCLVGSSNMNHRSILHDLEVDVVLTAPESQQLLEKQFELDLEKSIEVKINDLNKRPFLTKIIGWLIHKFRHWL